MSAIDGRLKIFGTEVSLKQITCTRGSEGRYSPTQSRAVERRWTRGLAPRAQNLKRGQLVRQNDLITLNTISNVLKKCTLREIITERPTSRPSFQKSSVFIPSPPWASRVISSAGIIGGAGHALYRGLKDLFTPNKLCNLLTRGDACADKEQTKGWGEKQ